MCEALSPLTLQKAGKSIWPVCPALITAAMGSCISRLPFTLKGPKFPAPYTKNSLCLQEACAAVRQMANSNSPEGRSDQEGDTKNLPVKCHKIFTATAGKKKNQKKYLWFLRSLGLQSPGLGMLLSLPRGLPSQHLHAQSACQTGSLTSRNKPESEGWFENGQP